VKLYCTVESPVGRLLLTSDGHALTGLYFSTPQQPGPKTDWVQNSGAEPLRAAARQLREYFGGTRRRFDLALSPEGTEFQRRVWRALTEIPFGETWSYGQLARRIDHPNASRAVGLANGRNPIAVIIPCHRVIGADGSLTGFGGGLARKQWLLDHEGLPGTAALPFPMKVGEAAA
jgi:methylated-DNA-[protein]-cysteine S-methyltransferase